MLIKVIPRLFKMQAFRRLSIQKKLVLLLLGFLAVFVLYIGILSPVNDTLNSRYISTHVSSLNAKRTKQSSPKYQDSSGITRQTFNPLQSEEHRNIKNYPVHDKLKQFRKELSEILGNDPFDEFKGKELLLPESQESGQRKYYPHVPKSYNTSLVEKTSLGNGAVIYNITEEVEIKVMKDSITFGPSLFHRYKSEVPTSILPSKLLLPSPSMCSNESLYLLIIVPSVWSNSLTRHVIRTTWGSPAYNPRNMWINQPLNKTVRLVFLFGGEELDDHQTSLLRKEHQKYNDIVLLDFVDSYRNLSVKIAAGLQWVELFCPNVQHIAKIDEDTFVHLPQLLQVIKAAESKAPRFILGRQHMSRQPRVVRHGRWKVGLEYPLPLYPRYVYGHSYVISRSAVTPMLQGYRNLPLISNEDALFTGILAKLANITRLHHRRFAYGGRREIACEITQGRYVSVTSCCDDHLLKLFRDMQTSVCDRNINLLYPAPGCRFFREYNKRFLPPEEGRVDTNHMHIRHRVEAHSYEQNKGENETAKEEDVEEKDYSGEYEKMEKRAVKDDQNQEYHHVHKRSFKQDHFRLKETDR